MGRVEDKVCMVTGAAMGLGRAFSEALVAEGAFVVMTDIDNGGEKVARNLGSKASFIPLDVSNESAWIDTLGQIEAQYGHLDVLINNAGIVESGDIEVCTTESWTRHMNIMVNGTFFGCKHAMPLLRKATNGSIINMASTASKVGIAGIPAYSAAKGAIASLTRSVAVHCIKSGYEIRCNSVHPTNVDTPMLRAALGDNVIENNRLEDGTVLTRTSRPNDVTPLIIYLASDESLMANGAEFALDRGVTIMEGVAP